MDSLSGVVVPFHAHLKPWAGSCRPSIFTFLSVSLFSPASIDRLFNSTQVSQHHDFLSPMYNLISTILHTVAEASDYPSMMQMRSPGLRWRASFAQKVAYWTYYYSSRSRKTWRSQPECDTQILGRRGQIVWLTPAPLWSAAWRLIFCKDFRKEFTLVALGWAGRGGIVRRREILGCVPVACFDEFGSQTNVRVCSVMWGNLVH